MVELTLPVIGGAPPLLVFQALEWLAIALVHVLLGLAVVSISVLVTPLVIMLILYYVKPSRRTPNQQERSSRRKRMKSVFLFMGRLLCVNTFPVLFKAYKTRSRRDQTRKFMLFLDRKVESSAALIVAFCSIVFCIFCSSAAVFFRFFPVERSAECLEMDSQGRSLFCYSNINSSLMSPSLPVDCANYTLTELREFEFQCYAIVSPAGLGIAVAAAFGLAEVGIVGVTIFIKVTEGFFKKTKDAERQSRSCCCCGPKRANRICVCSSIVLLVTVFLVSSAFTIFIIIDFLKTDMKQLLHFLYYLAYLLLPALICLPLIYIILNMKAHCDKGEYVSIAVDQRPLDRRDRDEESESSEGEGEQDVGEGLELR